MKKLITLLCLVLSAHFLNAQDAEGCKDHPMLNRMPDFLISQCSENFASLDLAVGPDGKTQYEEGTRTHLEYSFNAESQHKFPSWLQVVRNYENAILKSGGKKIYSDVQFGTYKITKDGNETFIMITFNAGTELEVQQYYVDVLAKENMKQDISANDIYAALNTTGSIALYINFETGKSAIKAESLPIVDQIVQMLKDNPTLKVSVEGHTDNVGTAASNQTLSESRAKALMNALIAKGIDKSRLVSKGWGQTKPIADNATDDGKAKNRRVEIVKS